MCSTSPGLWKLHEFEYAQETGFSFAPRQSKTDIPSETRTQNDTNTNHFEAFLRQFCTSSPANNLHLFCYLAMSPSRSLAFLYSVLFISFSILMKQSWWIHQLIPQTHPAAVTKELGMDASEATAASAECRSFGVPGRNLSSASVQMACVPSTEPQKTSSICPHHDNPAHKK